MKKYLILLISLISFAAFAQPGSLSQSVYRSRVNDSSTVNGATAQGYGYFLWNNQKAVPSWQFWNGTSLVDWNPSTSGGSTPTLQQVITAGSVLTGNNAITGPQGLSIETGVSAGGINGLDASADQMVLRSDTFYIQDIAGGNTIYSDNGTDKTGLARGSDQIEIDGTTGITLTTDNTDGIKVSGGGTLAQTSGLLTKAQVGDYITSRQFKKSVKASSTSNIDLNNAGASMDGITLATQDRVLLKDQSTGSQNGIYSVVSLTPTVLNRVGDFSSSTFEGVLTNSLVLVDQGTTNGGKAYRLSTTGTITIGTTALTFTEFGAGGGSSSPLLTINEQTGDYTILAADTDPLTEIVMNSGSAQTLTIPPGLDVGAQVLVRHRGAGALTFTAGAGQTLVPSSGTAASPGQGYSSLFIQEEADYWTIDNGAPALISADITTALGYTPWATTGTTTVTTPTITQTLAGSGTTNFLTFTGAAHTGQTASTELIDIDFGLNRTVTFATGALTTQRAMTIRPPTYAFAGASTITNAYALNITGPPVAGTNATITNRYSLGVASTTSSFNVSATLANFSKFGGTGLVIQNGSIVLSNSAADPTLSNTIQVGTVSNVSSITSAGSNTPITYNSTSHSQTSGTVQPHRFVSSFGPTSGTATVRHMTIEATTNQTGGANGNATALSVEATWTAAGGTPVGIDYVATGTPTNHVGLRVRPTDALNGFGVGTSVPNSTVQVNGSFSTAYVAKTALYTLTSTDHTVEVTSGTHTQTLPTAVGIAGRIYIITNSGAGVVTVGTTSSQTFVNVTATPTTLTLNQFETATVQSNGANWLRL